MISRVLYCDVLSMYPTVCTLMGLWRFVIAQGVAWEEVAPEEIQELLARITPADLRRPEAWQQLPVLVQIQPESDILPVRAPYDEHDGSAGGASSYTIGLNYLTSRTPLWFTLADCMASTLLAGQPPRVLRALRFRPVGVQEDLQPIDILGNPAYHVDPAQDDFYRRVIDLRTQVKRQVEEAEDARNAVRAAQLKTQEQALKIMANATSYGIFVELNVTEQEKSRQVTCFGPHEEGFVTRVHNVEEEGRYFHPLLATLITGAARLMLGLAERLATDAEISWAFCDTDSMALAQPNGMDDETFLERARAVRD
jgi:hypothetical protein